MLRETFRKTISSFGMDQLIRQKKLIIAAFSGGADSSAMLRLLAEYAAENKIPLVCAHVNHKIRGEEADADEQFARNVAASLKLPIYVAQKDVPAYAEKNGCGLEEAAREVRYSFFDELSCQLTGGLNAVVATAHNADDNLETVLFRLMRGSGLKGLCGIAPVRDGRFIRPLIACTGKEIRDYCRENEIPYVVDSTNANTEYTRNYIRHEIIPRLETVFERPQRTVLRTAELLREDDDVLEAEATEIFSKNMRSFRRDELLHTPPALSARILRKMYVYARGDTENALEYVHIKSMLRLAASDKSAGSVSLPGFVDFCVSRDSVYFKTNALSKSARNGDATDGYFRFEMDKNGSAFENSRYKIEVSPQEHTAGTEEYENIYKLSIHQKMCFDKIIGALYIKYRNKGDTYRYGGMTRKVKKLMIDRKLTIDEKNLLPLLCDDAGILWTPYYPVRDDARASEKEAKTLHIYFYEKSRDSSL